MLVLICIILFLELLFLIFGGIYLTKKIDMHLLLKLFLFFIYFSVLVLFNVIIVKIVEFNYYEQSFINNKINLLKTDISKYENTYEELVKKSSELSKSLDNSKYVDLKNEIDLLMKENSDLDIEIENLEEEKNSLNKQLEELQLEYENLEEKTKFLIDNFPTYNQFPNYPNGCESVSLYLMLKYYNVDVSVEELVEKLKKGDAPYRSNGTLYGGDPEIEFVGDPRLKSGYGVYEKPILEVANQFKNGMKNITGSNLDKILSIVKTGKPVQVWASINLRNTYICAKWQSTSTDRIVEWKCGLHSLVIIGYTYDKIITSDPYTGSIEYYSKTQFEKMYNTYGKRALYYEK